MFHSEVTVFFEKEYYQSFFYEEDLRPVSESPSNGFGVSIPKTFEERGVLVEWQEDLGDGEVTQSMEKRWTIGPLP
jgi:hypothetical protein